MTRPRIQLTGKGVDMHLPLGDGPVLPTAGGAQYDEETRPERTALTVFTGNELIRLDVPVLFDGWPFDSIEPQFYKLISYCRGQDGDDPPDFIATGPMPYSGDRFVMEYPDVGVIDYRRGGGESPGFMVRVRLVAKLVQFVNPDVIQPKHRGGHNKPKKVTLKKAMTYVQIAAHYLHDPQRGKEVAKLNGERDPRKQVKAGATVKLPAK